MDWMGGGRGTISGKKKQRRRFEARKGGGRQEMGQTRSSKKQSKSKSKARGATYASTASLSL